MRFPRHLFSALLVVLVIGAGCQRVGGPQPSPTGPQPGRTPADLPQARPAGVAGAWDVVLMIEGDPTEIPGVLLLEQDGVVIRGNFSSAIGITADGAGRVEGQQLSFAFSYNIECPGNAALVGTVADSGDQVRGVLSASDCTGEVRGTFRLTRERR